MKAIVLGGGLVGGVIAKDLARDREWRVTVADISERRINKLADEAKISGIVADLSDSEVIRKLVADQDIVIGAVPGSLAPNMLHSVMKARKNIVDISSRHNDHFALDELAKKNGVTAVITMGIAPGMSNMIVGYVDSLLDETESVLILVGGLPIIREWPFEYKISWSAMDGIRQFLRPAKLREYGEIVGKPALSEVELVDLPGVGTLEAFNTDGLGSLIHTIKAPFMKEKTLRYPGFAEKMRMFRETGFFSDESIELGGVKVKPIDFTAKLLFPGWELKEGERELTVMRVVVQGKKGQKKLQYTYDLLTYFDDETKTTSMGSTTGFPCAIVARLVAQGEYTYKGVCLPELLGREYKVYRRVIKGLEERGIFFKESIVEL